MKADGASVLGGVGNTASGLYSAIVGGTGTVSPIVMSTALGYSSGAISGRPTCATTFVKSPLGSIAYITNTYVHPELTAVICTGGPGMSLAYTISPSLSILGGNMSLSSTMGIISGTTGPAALDATLFTILVIDGVSGLADILQFYITVSTGEQSTEHAIA